MLHIQDGKREITWRVGQPVPLLTGKVIKLQADGRELDLLMEALKSQQYYQDVLVRT